jgi:hypothetical protein
LFVVVVAAVAAAVLLLLLLLLPLLLRYNISTPVHKFFRASGSTLYQTPDTYLMQTC